MNKTLKENREMKDSGVEWIGKIPKDWKVKRNKYFLEEINLKNTNNKENLLSVSEYYGVVLRKEKISEDGFLTRAESLDGYKICKKDDLVMNIMLAWKKAMGVSVYDGIVSPAYCVYRGKNNIFMKYYHYLFRTDLYANIFKQYSTGIIDSRLRLYPEKFLSLSSHEPLIDEQEKIANFLDEKTSQFDLIISKKEKLIERLEEAKKSLISEVVTGKVKVVKTDDGYELMKRSSEEMKDSGVEWLGEIPKNWDVIKLKHLVSQKITDGPHETPELVDDGVPFLSAEAIVNSKISIPNMRGYITKEQYGIYAKKSKVCKNDILFCKSGSTTGKSALVTTDDIFAIWSPLAIIRANDKKIDYKNLFYVIQSPYFRVQVVNYWSFGTQPNIGMGTLENLYIPLSKNQQEQKSISEYLDLKIIFIDKLIDMVNIQIEKLKEAKQSLISEAVTGKMEVRER